MNKIKGGTIKKGILIKCIRHYEVQRHKYPARFFETQIITEKMITVKKNDVVLLIAYSEFYRWNRPFCNFAFLHKDKVFVSECSSVETFKYFFKPCNSFLSVINVRNRKPE